MKKEANLSACDGEFLVAMLALGGLVVFQPRVTLMGAINVQNVTSGFFFFCFKLYSRQLYKSFIFYLQSFVDLLEVLHLQFRPLTKMKAKQKNLMT